MVEHLRDHPRLTKTSPSGRREKLSLGRLFIPEKLAEEKSETPIPLVIAFHCGDWIPELAVSGLSEPLPCITMQLGSGSSRYSKPFLDDPKLMEKLLEESEKRLGRPVSHLILVGWSAGYGSIRELIGDKSYEPKIKSILLLDGLHTGYVGRKPGPMESMLEEDPLKPFLAFAQKALKGEKQFYYLHTEIFPGTFASTTETADWLIKHLDLKHSKFSVKERESAYFLKLLERFKEVCSLTELQIKTSHNKAMRCHTHEWKATSEPSGFGLKGQLGQCEGWQFQISSNEHGRVHGIFINDVFFVVWLDPEHALYP